MLCRSKDRQIRDLWCGGIDLLDDLHWDDTDEVWVWRPSFLCGVTPNLLSAYGLESNGSTTSTAAQDISHRVAEELHSFIDHDPPLYERPIPIGADAGSLHRIRLCTTPWCNFPLGQAPKDKAAPSELGNAVIRIIINMSSPEKPSNKRTVGGEVVISLNDRAQIHPPD